MRRRSISREFFSVIAVTLLLGLTLMCGIQTALSAMYFARERKAALAGVLDGAAALTARLAEPGGLLADAQADGEHLAAAQADLALLGTTSGAVLFITDSSGRILLHTGEAAAFTGAPVPPKKLTAMAAGADLFETGRLGGVYTGRCYTAGRALHLAGRIGFVFAATPMGALRAYLGETLSIFILSAALMLLFSGILTVIFSRRVTAPIEAVSEAARRLGGGDFAARAPVGGYEELADFAATFNAMAERLQTIDNARGQFMGNIAHELRTPMTTIKGFIDGMLDGTIPPAESQRYLTIVSQETGRLARLVQNMLDITKLEAGEVAIDAREYDIWQTVTDVVLADEQRIEDARIDIEGLGGSACTVYADPDLVHQVVYNLVDNAIKFTPAGGRIRFAAQRQGDRVSVSVENTGEGIAADALPHVFERFYKEDRSRGLNTRGAGLGLHICKVLVTLQGGEIRVESEAGSWCRFVFTLPAAAPRRPEAPATRPGKRRGRKHR